MGLVARWAAVAAAAAGTLLVGARDAWAFTWNGGRFYFDANGWDTASHSHVQMMVGHSSYSCGYPMTQIGSSKVYYVDVSKWTDATWFAFIAADGDWGGEGNGTSRLAYAPIRTASYSGDYTFNSSANYLFQKASANNDASISPVYIGDNGFTSVTTPQVVDWYNGSGASSGNWEQSGYTLWWYNGNSGFRWVNVTNFGAQHVRINNDAISTSQTVTENTTVASLTFGSSAATKHTLSASSGKTLTVNQGITNAASVAHEISAPLSFGANTINIQTLNSATGDSLVMSGNITASGTVHKRSTATTAGAGGKLKLTAQSANFSGTLQIGTGTVAIARSGTWGKNTSTIRVPGAGRTGRRLELSGGVAVQSANVYLDGASTNLVNVSGNNALAGTVVIGKSTAVITNLAGNLGIATLNLASNAIVAGPGNTYVTNITGTASVTFTGTGTLTIRGATGTTGFGSSGSGTVVLDATTDPSSGLGGSLCNLAVTNGASSTLVLHKETRIRRMNFATGSTIQMDVLSQNSAALLGINQNSSWTGTGYSVNIDTNGTFTLKLVKPTGSTFNPANNASFTVLEARHTNGSFNDNEMKAISLDVSSMPGDAATLANWSKSKTTNATGKANAGIKLTYTAPAPPTMVTVGAVNISSNAARLKGKMTADGGSTVTSYGIVYGTSANPTTSDNTLPGGTGAPTANAEWYVDKSSGLSPNTTYHYRAYAIYGSGSVAYGDDMTFTTAPLLTLTTTYTYPGAGNTITLAGGGGGGTGALSYTLVSTTGSAAGSISGSALTVTACGTASATGKFNIKVTRAAQGNYAAQNRQFSVTVNKAANTVTFGSATYGVKLGDDGLSVSASATYESAGITYTGNNDSVATVNRTTGAITTVAAGYVTITATSAQTVNYAAATATCEVVVRPTEPSPATNLHVTNTNANWFSLGFTKATTSSGTLILVKKAALTGPMDGIGVASIGRGTAASPKNLSTATDYNSSGQLVVLNSSAATRTPTYATNATPAAHYYAGAYEFNTIGNNVSATNKTYSYAAGALVDFWTLATEPTAGATLTDPPPEIGSGSVSLSWSKGTWAANAALGETGSALNTLVVIYGPADSAAAAAALAETAPKDGHVYSGNALGGTVVHAGTGTSAVASGLTKLKYYKVVAYAYAKGEDDSTANYFMTSHSITFQTQDSNGPQVWATGVDGTSFLLNWSPVAGATTGYDVEAGGEIALLDEGFTKAEGWASAGTNVATAAKTAASGKWTQNYCGIQATTDDGSSCAYPCYSRTGAYIEFPALTGTVTAVKAYLGATDNSPSATKGLKLQQYNGSSWTDLQTFSGTFSSSSDKKWFTYTPAAPIAANGLRLRLYHLNENTVYIYHIRVEGSSATGLKGHDLLFTGLTSGETYTAKVRKNPSGDWSDMLPVTAGVVPGEISTDAMRSSVTFTWTDGESGAAGYKVDATTEEPASATVEYSCPANNGLGTNQWYNGSSWLQWEYTGDVSTESVTSSYITKGPGFVNKDAASKGHYLIGRAGQAVASTNFDLEGATNAVLSFDNCAWNSANASTTIESSRLDVYYRLDGTNEWNYFATCIATNTGDNLWVSQSMALPRGALDGDTLAVKIVAPNAEYYNSALRGAGVRNIKLTLQKAAGRYGPGHSLEGYPKTIATPSSHTVTGLDPETKVYFRVQALQGSTNAPTAKSVWVEGEGETSGLVASATAQEDGTILVTWIPPTGTGVVILRGRDERHDPATPLDLANLPHGYEIVTNATGGAYHENTSPTSPVEQSCVDSEPLGGWKYYYYIYAATDNGDGTITVGAGPSRTATGETPNAVVKGMVNAIASQGFDGWDVHPWGYKKGRVTNPNTDSVQFIDPSQNNGKPTWETRADYTTLYGSTNQLDVYERTNYYGTNSFRLSGGSCVAGVNSNNPAIQFESIDLSGYKNVEFSMHFAGDVIEGGDDMHVAISTNGGTQWLKVSRTNEGLWKIVSTNTYGIVVGDSTPVNNGHWDFYFEDFNTYDYTAWDGSPGKGVPTPEGNPYKLRVPDSVTQFMARVMYYDSQGANRYSSSYFIDEVRLVGEAAMKTPHPTMENISSNSFVVTWDAVPDATSYDVRVASCAATGDDAVKVQQAFVLNVMADGWTTNGSTSMSTNFNRTGSGYGLRLFGSGATLTSPETGAARSLEFWSKAVSANSNSKLQVEVSADGTTWEVLTNYTAAGSSSATAIGADDWVKKSVDLPHRQWSRVRFHMLRTGNSTTGNFYLDDIKISGGGDYDTCLVKQYTGLTGTSQGFTNGLAGVSLSPGTAYYVEVRANGSPGGYLTHSPWGETGDYTGSDFHAVPDGFEMVRLTWAASSGILVMAVPEGQAYTNVVAPTNTAVGGINGTGVVLTNSTAAVSGAGFEHVRPYGLRTEDYEAKYVVYWKHGSYWEGRLETNVVLGTYVAQAAEAFAYTNGTAMTAKGSQAAFNTGKGWASAWEVTEVPWSGAWAGQEVQNGSQPYGLVATNKLWGAGGNMLALYPTNNNTTASVKRVLSAPLSKNAEWWGMFTMKVTYSGDNKWAGMQLLNSSGANKASIGKLWGGSGIGVEGSATYTSTQTIGDGGTKTIVFHWDKSKMWLKTFNGGSTFNPTDSAPAFDGSVALSMDDIHAIQLVAQNGSGVLYPVWFDEIRLGATWEDLVGKQTEPPMPVKTPQAWADGNELVRIAWQYDGGRTNAGVINPLATGVRIYAKEGVGEGEWTEIYKGTGTNATPAKDAWSRWDHVVRPGSTHQYRVEAYAGGKYTNAVDAVNRDAAPSTEVSTGLYGEKEYLETMSYTNNTGFAAGVWKGGHGFGDESPSAWTLQGDNTGTWTNVNPETAQAAVHITNAVLGSRLAVGNVLKATLGDLQKAGIERQLGGDAWCGHVGEAFYVAFRMAYQWGNEGGRRAGMRITDTDLKYVEIGKGLGNDEGYKNRFGVTATADGSSYSTGWTSGADSMRGFGDAGNTNAFLVVARIYWRASGKADVSAVHYAIGDAAHPATLPGEEADVTWTASYSNATISNVRKLELIAQSETSGTIGTAYFDEIRYGTSWEDIIGATEPEDVWTGGLTISTNYKGDFATWKIYSKPNGPKQSAWVTLCSNDATFANATVQSNTTTWLDKEWDTDHWNSVWEGHELQFKGAGTWYGGGVVKGEVNTVKSWERATPAYQTNKYVVQNLPNPTKTNSTTLSPEVFAGDAKLGLAWAPARAGGRTFPEVMIVRFAGDAAAWSPTDGTVYLKGGKVASNAGTVVYRGTNETVLVDKGLNTNTTYRYQFYTVNNSYYSPGVSVSQTTTTNAPPIEINGDPNDWIGEPSEVKNSSAMSPNGEWIWTDKVGDGRKDTDAAKNADITEFRMKVDATNVYFMVRLNTLSDESHPYIAVGVTTNVEATRLATTGNEDGENWIGDESSTFMGGNLFSPASLHYADIQMGVHQVANVWQIELFKKGGSSWYGPGGVGDVTWTVASSTNYACIEWRLERKDLGLDFGSVTPARFTVASFANGNGWNNDTVATANVSDGTSHAVDTLAIAPWGQNDKDLALTAWDEGIKNFNAEYWFDIWFGPTALHNSGPSRPVLLAPANNATNVPASPTMTWEASSDHGGTNWTGFVVGYFVEVSTNSLFNGLEGTTENGPISCRVNIPGATNTSYRYITDSREYWWRVRARDNSGTLSDASEWHYVVQGKTDNEGPQARLLYVGTNVMMFVTNEAYRTEQIISGDATSVLDSELEDGGHTFGFVLEWYDVNGVFATNWFREHRGDGSGDPSWPKGDNVNPYKPGEDYDPSPGDFAWNILAEHSDGVAFGRVSPNWDLIIVDRGAPASGPKPKPEVVNGVTNSYTNKVGGLVLPTDDGGTETVDCWFIDCGLDRVFQTNETICVGNDGQYVTNYVRGAFSIANYRTNLDIYLTVSAEDGCETGEYGPTMDYPAPLYDSTGDSGAWQGQSGLTYQLSGWCYDQPNPSRNVTTNQLLHIHVRDNDMIPPVASTAKWGATATNEAGEKLLPSVVVSTGTPASGAWDPTWARLGTNGLARLPIHDGQGKTLQWHLTDADVVANGGTWKGSGNKLNFFFNVYDEYLHSGMQVATNHAAGLDYIKTITPTLKRTNWMDNTGMILGSSGSAWTNWAGYAIGISTNKRQGDSALHGEGTDPDTVLAWTYDAAQTNLEALLGTANPLEAIGPDASGEQAVVTNTLKLFAWDSDNNAAGDQEGAEIAFGQLAFSDDDATRPIIPTPNEALGTGTNYVRYGTLAGWTVSGNSSSVTVRTNETMHGMTATRVWGGTNGAALPDVTSGTKANGVYWANNRLTMSYVKGKGRYYEFDLAGLNETRWTADTLVFNSYVSSTGPETLELTWLSPGSEEESQALSGGELTAGWSTNGACLVQTVSGFDRIKMASSAGTGTLKRSTPISTAGKVHARVNFRAGAFGDAGPEADTGPTLTVTVKRNGSTVVTNLDPIKLTNFVATAAAENYRNWLEYDIELPTNAPGSSDTYTIEWTASGVNGSKGFLLRDVGYRTEGAFASETTLATMRVPKGLDENKDAAASNPYLGYTETTVTMMWTGTEVGDNETRRFRLYAYDGDQVAVTGTWGIKDISIHGIASAPKGHEITDRDMKEGNWSMALEVSDDSPSGYDTVQSGLWIEGDGGSYTQYVPRYKLLYPAAYAGHSGETVATADYPAGGITPAVYTYTADGDFTNVPCQWGLTGEAAPTAFDHAHDGNKVLLLPSNGVVSAACRTNVLSTAGLVGSVSGATVSGMLRLRSLSTAEGVDNAVTLTLEMLDASSAVLATRVLDLAADRQVGWREVVLPQWPVDSKDVAKLKITIAQANATGAEVYVDGVDIRTALWGGESEDVENGKVLGARFSLTGNALGRKTMPLSDSPEMSGSGSHEYALVSTVYDYDHDREGDALGVSSTNTFSLYDNDEEAPALGKRFGGSLSARLGSAANSKHTESGTNVTVHVTDKDMAEAYGADHEARMDLDIDAYDFSGWGVTAIDLQYGGASSRLYTEGAGDNFLTFAMTNDAARYDQPSATNTLGASVLSWWNRTGDVRAEFAKTNSEALQPMPVRAFISDWDDDRVGDSMVLRDTEVLGKQVGMLYFLDSDFNAPAYKPYYTNIEHFFVGTNDVATTFEKIVKGGAPWGSAEKSMRELRRTDGTGLATNTLIYTNQVYTIYDSELRTNSNFYIMANLGDRSGGIGGQSIAGIRQGTTATTPWTDAFGTAFAITNTTASIYRGGSLVTNLASHWSTNYSSSQRTTRSIGGAAVQTWLYSSAMARDEVGLLLPSGVAANDLLVKFDVWDADFDRPGDQMHSELDGPALRIRDNDTVRPNNPTDVQVNGAEVPASVTRENAAWTNSLANWNVSFVAATDGPAVEPDLLATGVDPENGYRMVEKVAGIDTGSGNWWLPLTNVVAMTTSEDGERLRAGLTAAQQTKVVQGLTTQLVFAVDRDDDRPGDSLASSGVEVPLAYDITPPPVIGTGDGKAFRLDAAESADDPTTQFDLTWPTTVADGVQLGPDDTKHEKHPTKKAADYDYLSPWATYKIYYGTFDETAVPAGDLPFGDSGYIYTNFVKNGAYKTNAFVTTNSTAIDPSAGATPYGTLGTVSTTGSQSVRLYDLDFDQHYWVVIVGVDRAGNEGPAGQFSWATNNTIKFAITQGVVRASSAINAAVGVASGTNSVGMAPIPSGGPSKAAALYWMAAGMKDGVGRVTKYYDLIYRDAPSFNELGNETWLMAGEAGGNSGTSKTNWNYQVDTGLNEPNRLRFFRASYSGRWQTINPTTGQQQQPLASEEVYSMNNVVLSQGRNYVSLQGVPYTNTFAAVFGTDTNIWGRPAGSGSDPYGVVRIRFYKPGAAEGSESAENEWYFFGWVGGPDTNRIGGWVDGRSESMADLSGHTQPSNFFTRPFSIIMPDKVVTTNGTEVTTNKFTDWWNVNNDTNVTAWSGTGAKRKKLDAVMWHPILQVPTNASAIVYTNNAGKGMYNPISLGLPVRVHPRQLELSGIKKSNLPWNADKVYVIDTATKSIRGNSTMYCDAAGNWHFNTDTNSVVPEGFIHPNDMIVIVSAGGTTNWTWTPPSPTNFYHPPTRHMGHE